MSRETMRFTAIALTLLSAGCVDRSKNEQVVQSVANMQFVNVPGLAFRSMGHQHSGGTAAKLATEVVIGELTSTNDASLPAGLADTIAGGIRAELQNQGCNVTGGGQGGGIHYTAESGVSNANIEKASIYYSLNGAKGRVDVLVIERDYAPDSKTKVVGQLIVTVNESR